MPYTRIAELAAQIHENTVKVDDYLQRNNLPSPSFDEDGPVDFKIEDEEIRKARETAIDSSLELHQLLLGPAMCLRPVLNGVSLQTIYKYDIASHVPIHGSISFPELARKCNLSPTKLRRIVRFAIAYHRVFQEPRKGYVSHSAASRKLAEDANAKAGLGYMFDEVWQSFAHTVEAMERFNHSDEPNRSGWSLSQQTDMPVWEYYASRPDMAKRFARSMSTFSNGFGLSPDFLNKGYPWSSIIGHYSKSNGDSTNNANINGSGNGNINTNSNGDSNDDDNENVNGNSYGHGNSNDHGESNGKECTGTVVDVGGSRGNISIALAQTHGNLHFIVQDLPDMISGALDGVPADVAGRIEFMPHDFFRPQPVLGADVYLFRNIFHNWSDGHMVRILRATVPALRPGARVVVNDYLIPEPMTMAPSKEREIREKDMIMLSLFNARERERSDWEQIFQEADPRFGYVTIWVPDGATLAIIEVVWAG